MKLSSAFYVLGLVACYSRIPAFGRSSQGPSSFLLVTENLEWNP